MTLPTLWWSIDPGALQCYCVRWRGTELDLAVVTDQPLSVTSDTVLVCEQMQVRPGGAYAADLIAVTRMAGRVTAKGTYLPVAPETWKGQVPKAVHQRTRILPRLSESDVGKLQMACPKKSEMHNLVDAVGIGLWYIDMHGGARG
jgi:hypothetical protein